MGRVRPHRKTSVQDATGTLIAMDRGWGRDGDITHAEEEYTVLEREIQRSWHLKEGKFNENTNC